MGLLLSRFAKWDPLALRETKTKHLRDIYAVLCLSFALLLVGAVLLAVFLRHEVNEQGWDIIPNYKEQQKLLELEEAFREIRIFA